NPATGKVYSMKETLDVVGALKVGKNDNVLIFQSGHGSIGNGNQPELSQRLVMDGGSMTRGQIQQPLETLKPRSILFLTDCCSDISKRGPGRGTPKFVSLEEPNVLTIRNLMLRPKGPVSITAADDGKLAAASFRGPNPGKAGSAFTVAMVRLWYNDATYTSWEQFFPVLKAETGKASGGRQAARAFQIKSGVIGQQ